MFNYQFISEKYHCLCLIQKSLFPWDKSKLSTNFVKLLLCLDSSFSVWCFNLQMNITDTPQNVPERRGERYFMLESSHQLDTLVVFIWRAVNPFSKWNKPVRITRKAFSELHKGCVV